MEMSENTKPPPHWPPGVRLITIDAFDLMGVDDQGRLYFDGKQIATVSEVRLTTFQTTLAVLAAMAAISMGVFDVLRFFGMGAN